MHLFTISIIFIYSTRHSHQFRKIKPIWFNNKSLWSSPESNKFGRRYQLRFNNGIRNLYICNYLQIFPV